MKLSELKTGESGVIAKVYGHGGFRKRIIESANSQFSFSETEQDIYSLKGVCAKAKTKNIAPNIDNNIKPNVSNIMLRRNFDVGAPNTL